MKKLILLSALIVALPLSALASSVGINSNDGTTWVSDSGISTSSSSGFTSASQIGRVSNLYGKSFSGPNLGGLTFSTGALTSGTLGSTSMFASGGSFTVALNGAMKGLPNAVLFQGAFSSPVTLTQIAGGLLTLTGNIRGYMNGHLVNGIVTMTLGGLRNGQMHIGNVKVDIALPVPEPGTLTMLGTGLLVMAGLVRRKRSLGLVSR